MGCCCGTTQKVRKIPINPEYKLVQQTKPQVREDDIIQVPKDKRKLFRVHFDLKTILPPEYLIVNSLDYSMECRHVQMLSEMIIEENSSIKESKLKDITTQNPEKGKDEKSLNESLANNKHEESTQANRTILQKQIQIEVIDQIELKKKKEYVLLS